MSRLLKAPLSRTSSLLRYRENTGCYEVIFRRKQDVEKVDLNEPQFYHPEFDAAFEDVSEGEIESNFTSYRPYIESSVKTIDLLVFFELFSSDQVKTLYRKAKVDPAEATRLTFDIIVDMKSICNKFQYLVHVLQEADYPKLVQLLEGLLIPVHGIHREKLKTCAKDIYQRLSVSEILPYLLTRKVLNHHDLDEVRSIVKNESNGSAVLQLLSIIPNRNKDWFEHFLWALLESKQKELALIIDEDTTKKLEDAAALGIVSPVGESSLGVSVKGLKRKLSSKTNLSGKELKQAEFIQKLESIKVPPSSVSSTELSKADSEQQPCISTDLDTADDIGNVKTNIDDECIECSPCRRKDCVSTAMFFCAECCEHFCASCEEFHRSLRITKFHKVLMIQCDEMSNSNEHTGRSNILLCFCHPRHEVEVYCRSHEDLVCLDHCLKEHERCNTVLIRKITDAEVIEQENHNAEKKRKIFETLTKLSQKSKEDRAMLNYSIEMCSSQIIDFANDLQSILADLKSKALDELCDNGNTQKMQIDGSKEICRLLKFYLGSKMPSSNTVREIGDSYKMFITNVRMSKGLRKAERIVETVENSRSPCLAKFQRDAYLVGVTNVYRLGTFERSDTKENEKKGNEIVSDLEKVRDLVASDIDNDGLENVPLGESWATESSFLKPYFHFIQKSTSGSYKEWELVGDD